MLQILLHFHPQHKKPSDFAEHPATLQNLGMEQKTQLFPKNIIWLQRQHSNLQVSGSYGENVSGGEHRDKAEEVWKLNCWKLK